LTERILLLLFHTNHCLLC